MNIKIGPAGLGPVASAEEMLKKYHELGFQACEIAFVRQVYIHKDEDLFRIGKKAKELGIELSIHAQYYVNLNSEEEEKREATKKRILDCCKAGEKMGVKVVVFHPGYYTKKGKDFDLEKSYQTIKRGVLEIMEEIENKRWKIKIAPETMGKVNVFGSKEEIAKLVRETGCSFCIDFAHILAREGKIDFSEIENLFPQKEWHCHFSGIVYGDKGEKHHRSTERKEWTELLKNLPKDRHIRIINESPTMIEDCVEGLGLLR